MTFLTGQLDLAHQLKTKNDFRNTLPPVLMHSTVINCQQRIHLLTLSAICSDCLALESHELIKNSLEQI